MGTLMAFTMTGSLALGSEKSAIDVLQPIDIENVIHLSHVTYISYDDGDPAILAVGMTCDSNLVISGYGPSNLNVAFTAKLKVRVVFPPDNRSYLFGDTLRVALDTRGLEAGTRESDWSDSTIVEATIECIMANAATSPSVRVVDLRVEGDRKYRGYGGVRSTRRFRAGPLRRDFR
jgi:hypothetical protein